MGLYREGRSAVECVRGRQEGVWYGMGMSLCVPAPAVKKVESPCIARDDEQLPAGNRLVDTRM